MNGNLPLSGVRVVDFTWVGAGPLTTKFFADFGAEVIKIESKNRPDPLRRTPPLAPGTDELERSGYFANRNAGKKSLALDMNHPAARSVALRLVATSDICAQSFRPGTMEKWGLGYDDLRAVRPDLIYLAMPMQGEWGPHANFSGFGATLVALSGLHDLCGYPDRLPVGTGTNYPDHVPNPMHAALAVLTALMHRRRTGEGQYIEVSQLESTLNVIGPAIEDALVGRPTTRQGNRLLYAAPHGVYPAAGTDRWIAISVMNDCQWSGLVAIARLANVGFADVGLDATLATFEGRKANEELIDSAIAQWTRNEDAVELAVRLNEAGVPASEVRNARDLLSGDNELLASGAFEWLDHPVMGSSVYNAPTPRLSRTSGRLGGPSPLLGHETREVCMDIIGMDQSEYDELCNNNVLY